MKSRIVLLSIIVFSTTYAGFSQENSNHALIGVEIFNGESDDLKGMTILVTDGIIKDIFKDDSKTISDSFNKIDLSNHYVIPGLIDTHVHMGMKGLSNSPDASRKEFIRWVYSGVTTVRDMGGDARALFRENQLIKENEQPGPDIYFSATVGSSDQINKDLRLKRTTQGIGIANAGYVIEAKTDMDIKEQISMAVNSNVTGVKFYAGIKSNLIRTITDEAHKKGLKSWSHFTVFPDRPIEVVKAGVDVVSHVWGAFWQDQDVNPAERVPFTHTDFSNASAAIYPEDLSMLNADIPELQSLFKEMRERNVIWDLTHVVPNPKIRALYVEYAIAASKSDVDFCTGTDFFNDISEPFPAVFEVIEGLVEDGILDTKQALIAATINGAKAIGIENTHGSIDIGKTANLVVLRKTPIEDIKNIREIVFTMKNGVLYQRSDFN